MVYYAASSEQCLLKVNEVRFQGQLIVIQGLFFLFFDLHHKECQLINRTLMMNLFSPRFKVCGFSMLTQITNWDLSYSRCTDIKKRNKAKNKKNYTYSTILTCTGTSRCGTELRIPGLLRGTWERGYELYKLLPVYWPCLFSLLILPCPRTLPSCLLFILPMSP